MKPQRPQRNPLCPQKEFSHHSPYFTKEPIIEQTYSSEISPSPSFPKRGIPPFGKGREGGI
jgi:hypothetical protein